MQHAGQHAGQQYQRPQGHSEGYGNLQPTRSMVAADYKTTSRVELRFMLRNLIKLDTLSMSDPCISFYQWDGSRFDYVGRTEWLQNQKNCQFVKSFQLNYCFGQDQVLLFKVWDVDDPKGQLETQEFIGEVRCSLGTIIASPGNTKAYEIVNSQKRGRKNGQLIVTAEEMQSSAVNLVFNFSAEHLDKKDSGPFGKSDPFMAISRAREHGPSVLVHKTEVIKRTLKPNWKPFQISGVALCNADFDRPLTIDVFDWERDGSHDFIGRCHTSVNEIHAGKKQWPLINERKRQKKGKKYQNSGVLNCHSMMVQRVHTFFDYLAGGCEISLAFSIDFTGSNGNPAVPSSLHYINPYQPNEYQQAIMAVGNVVQHYDSDGMFPAYGFGCWFPPRRQVLHVFPLNGNSRQHECHGIQGVMAAYQQVLPHARLSGPTNFSPTIRSIASVARESHQEMGQRNQKYHILVIITDGEITDIQQTIGEVIAASVLPLSIIIVGVGSADFSKMDMLDSDEQLLSLGGRTAMRDIVQFVPFRKFKNNGARLAAEVLEEVPEQFLQYMRAHKIVPNPRRAAAPAPALDYGAAPALDRSMAPPPADYREQPSPPPPSVGPGYRGTTQAEFRGMPHPRSTVPGAPPVDRQATFGGYSAASAAPATAPSVGYPSNGQGDVYSYAPGGSGSSASAPPSAPPAW